jgi:hypothetical protein
MSNPIECNSTDDTAAVDGQNQSYGDGVIGFSNTGIGVHGVNNLGYDPDAGGFSPSCGVFGESYASEGVYGASQNLHGMHGLNGQMSGLSPSVACGVWGDSTEGYGVYASSKSNDAVHGESQSNQHAGVYGTNNSGGFGVSALSSGNDAVHGESQSNQHAGVYGTNTGGGPAGYFSGDVLVTGDVIFVNSGGSGDVAEDFDVEDGSAHEEPGTVLVINSSGKLCASLDPYDTRVAGVVSGAGELKPATVLQGRCFIREH